MRRIRRHNVMPWLGCVRPIGSRYTHFIRWQGHSQKDAEDLIQGFFARLIEKNDLADADPARGRFRTFLLASLRHFMANQRDRRQALKRGGGVRIVSIDVVAAEARLDRAHVA